MSRTESIYTLLDPSGQALLDEEYGKLLENIGTEAISMRVKNTNYSGEPTAGSVEIDRYHDAQIHDEGYAKTAGHGDKAKTKPVTINIGTDKENIQEIHQKDVAFKKSLDEYVGQLRGRQATAAARHLDTVFWATAKSEGRQFKPYASVSGIDKQFDKAVVLLQNLSNNFIDGVDISDMFAIFDNDTYMELKEEIDTKELPNVNTADGKVYYFHGVECESTHRLPEGVKFILMVKGYSLGQPAKFWYNPFFVPEYTNHIAMPMFFTYGTKAVAPESIL